MAEKKPDPIQPPDTKSDGWKSLQDEHADRLEAGYPWQLEQEELDFSVEANFVHFLKPMMFEGYVAQMGPKAFAVLMAIKCFTDATTGRAFPSRAKISQVTGLGLAAIDIAIKKLLDMGLLKKANTGKRVPTYTVVEAIPVKKQTGEVMGVAMKDYISREFKVEAIKEAIVQAIQSGSDAGKGLTLTVNLNLQMIEVNQSGDNAQFNNVGQSITTEVDHGSVGKSTTQRSPPAPAPVPGSTTLIGGRSATRRTRDVW